MKLTDFETLELAHAYEVVTDTKQVGSGQARGFFVNEECIGDYAGMKLWTLFNTVASDVTNPLFPLASAIIITASDASSYFGMDTTKADGIGNRAALAGLVAMGIMSQETADKFIAKTLSISYPFIDATLVEFDAAKADISTLGSAKAVVSYDVKDSIQAFHVRYKTNTTRIRFELDGIKTYNTNLTLRCAQRDVETQAFLPFDKPIYTTITIKAGQLGTTVDLDKFFGKHTTYEVTSDRIDAHTALVTTA